MARGSPSAGTSGYHFWEWMRFGPASPTAPSQISSRPSLPSTCRVRRRRAWPHPPRRSYPTTANVSRHSPDDCRTGVNSCEFPASLKAKQREARGRHFSAPAHRRTDERAELSCQRTNIGVFADVGPAKLVIAMLYLKQDLSLIHISEPTRLGMISYAVFCLKKK